MLTPGASRWRARVFWDCYRDLVSHVVLINRGTGIPPGPVEPVVVSAAAPRMPELAAVAAATFPRPTCRRRSPAENIAFRRREPVRGAISFRIPRPTRTVRCSSPATALESLGYAMLVTPDRPIPAVLAALPEGPMTELSRSTSHPGAVARSQPALMRAAIDDAGTAAPARCGSGQPAEQRQAQRFLSQSSFTISGTRRSARQHHRERLRDDALTRVDTGGGQRQQPEVAWVLLAVAPAAYRR